MKASTGRLLSSIIITDPVLTAVTWLTAGNLAGRLDIVNNQYFYTFWYHPMENTFGQLAGFFHMFLLLAQSILIFNRVHRIKFWTFSWRPSC